MRSTAAASTCCPRASACSSRRCCSRWLLGALNYNNNPALLLVLAARRRRAGQPDRRAPATDRAGGQRHRRRTGRRRRSHCGPPACAARTPAALRRGLRVDDDGTARIGAARTRPGQRRGRTRAAHPATRLARRAAPAPSTTRPLGLARAWAYVWPERRCWCIRRRKRTARRCRRAPAKRPDAPAPGRR